MPEAKLIYGQRDPPLSQVCQLKHCGRLHGMLSPKRRRTDIVYSHNDPQVIHSLQRGRLYAVVYWKKQIGTFIIPVCHSWLDEHIVDQKQCSLKD